MPACRSGASRGVLTVGGPYFPVTGHERPCSASSLLPGGIGPEHGVERGHELARADGGEAGRAAADAVAGAIAHVAWARIVLLSDGTQPDSLERPELERLLRRGQR